MKLLTNGALLCYDLSLVGHVSKAAIGSFYMALPAFNNHSSKDQISVINSLQSAFSFSAKFSKGIARTLKYRNPIFSQP